MIDYFETKSQPITKWMVLQAYKVVRANKGGSGIDGMTWEQLDSNPSPHLYKLWNRLSSGSYFPEPVRQVGIPKKGGGIRNLGIPTLLDRIAQQVVRAQLEPQLEPIFHPHSYGYRPGRGAHDAVRQSLSHCFNHDFVIDLDIKGFFDHIDHELLLKALRHHCKDQWVELYVSRWLKAGVMTSNGRTETPTGTPQGGVISPLLANLYLHIAFDQWMAKHHPEKPFERYADDIVVHCKTERQALYMLKQIEQRMGACKLELHPMKTKIVNMRGYAEKRYPKGYDFLGFTIKPSMVKLKDKCKLMPGSFVSIKSRTAMLAKFREMEIHKRRKPLEEIARLLNPMIRGMDNYYQKLRGEQLRFVWNQLNRRLLKWVKWEKGLYKMGAVRWLKSQYKRKHDLFYHWQWVQP
jgi:group II intron reverse transcriptase/maturase